MADGDPCEVCGADLRGAGHYLELEYWPGDSMGGRRLSGQVCDGCADRLAGYVLAEQARHGVVPS